MSNASDLNTRIQFFEYAPSDGPEPGEVEKRQLWECWAEIYEPSMKDIESLSTNVLYSVTARIRDPRGEYKPSNKHYLAVLDDAYQDDEGNYVRFNIKKMHPDVKDKRFIKVVAEATEWASG
ncbi:phage head-tail adapter protein [Pueribacillus theae]|uniref:Phage head-tail adapter protein n=1 Tax=Pueribacillus theae TaxID=2171751 RepID=A0A2U1JTY2_9BACI|nr:phage head-tail adapter protein [Pueribacillus theae]PWA08656.1 phage head-tail adapter protein [Pueribacillus theae]